jgi:protein-S-isoprenylcysteine O-methyltransferase Ste14
MKLLEPIHVIYTLIFTLLFVFDYFPNIPLAEFTPKSILIALILGLILFSMLFKKYRNANSKELLQWEKIKRSET